ncbi:unnamed protein product [Caenorhabditis brenneri]
MDQHDNDDERSKFDKQLLKKYNEFDQANKEIYKYDRKFYTFLLMQNVGNPRRFVCKLDEEDTKKLVEDIIDNLRHANAERLLTQVENDVFSLKVGMKSLQKINTQNSPSISDIKEEFGHVLTHLRAILTHASDNYFICQHMIEEIGKERYTSIKNKIEKQTVIQQQSLPYNQCIKKVKTIIDSCSEEEILINEVVERADSTMIDDSDFLVSFRQLQAQVSISSRQLKCSVYPLTEKWRKRDVTSCKIEYEKLVDAANCYTARAVDRANYLFKMGEAIEKIYKEAVKVATKHKKEEIALINMGVTEQKIKKAKKVMESAKAFIDETQGRHSYSPSVSTFQPFDID